MKVILDHIERVKKEPHHVRKQVAFAAAGTLTALIAVVWLGGSLATGVFALKPTSFAESTGNATITASPGGTAQVAGVAAAGAANTAARIEIMDVASSSVKKAEPTTIPF